MSCSNSNSDVLCICDSSTVKSLQGRRFVRDMKKDPFLRRTREREGRGEKGEREEERRERGKSEREW